MDMTELNDLDNFVKQLEARQTHRERARLTVLCSIFMAVDNSSFKGNWFTIHNIVFGY